MKVKSVMVPVEKLSCIDYNSTVRQAVELIKEKKFLSLPVVDGKTFKGMLSRRFVFETYFDEVEQDKAAFLARPVKEFVRMRIEPISPQVSIDAAAGIFTKSPAPFIPIIEANGDLMGIVTYQSIFKEYQNIYGTKYNCIVINCLDYANAFVQVGEIIAKNGGNIKNVVLRDGETMGMQEMHLRIECQDVRTIVQKLEKRGYTVVRVSVAEENIGR